MSDPHRVELHRPLPVERVTRPGIVQEIVATPEECAALAKRMAIPAVLSLACRFRLHAESNGAVRAEGKLTARVVQDCVVTLDPFESPLEEAFRVRFVPAAEATPDEDDPLDPESDDEIPFEGATIDLGEAAAEQLALALDPYPRKPGAEMPDEGADEPPNPFAALARLKRPID